MRKPTDVVEELNSWANVQDELAKRGIKGRRDSCYSCPVAIFLHRETGQLADVNHLEATFWSEGSPAPNMSFDLSPVVSRFILNFDDGEFPDLDVNPIDHEQDEWI